MEGTKSLVVKAIVIALVNFGVIMYQSFLHNSVLNLMYGNGWHTYVCWIFDVILALTFALWIWEAHMTIVRIRKRRGCDFEDSKNDRNETSVCRDVAGPIITWVLYIVFVITKTGFIFYGFMNEHEAMMRDRNTTDDLKWGLMMIGGVFLLETWSNENAKSNPERETFLYAASTMVLFDLFDAAEILDFWFGDQQVPNVELIRKVALAFHCFGLIFPLLTAWSVHHSRYGVVPLNNTYEDNLKVVRSTMINLPFLVLRAIDAHYQKTIEGNITYVTKALIAKNSYTLLITLITFVSKKCNKVS